MIQICCAEDGKLVEVRTYLLPFAVTTVHSTARSLTTPYGTWNGERMRALLRRQDN